MANKRKRKHPSKTHTDEPRKRLRSDVDEISTSLPAKHPTLSLYYPRIKSLRNYLLDSLLVSSKSRRRKIASFGLSRLQSHTSIPPASSSTCNEESIASNFGHEDHLSCHDNEEYLARLLDTTLVGVTGDAPPELGKSRAEDFASFSQQVSSTIGSSVGRGSSSQSEVIDFAIWTLFHRTFRSVHKPLHLLCHGYQRANTSRQFENDHCALASIPGIVSHFPNGHVDTLKNASWADLLGLLGKEGERIMLDMVLDCGIFMAVKSGKANYYQLSGIPLIDLQPLKVPVPATPSLPQQSRLAEGSAKSKVQLGADLRSPASITFVRSRMFYARAALNAKGRVQFGLRHIHVLNRYPDPTNPLHTVRVMKYIFPRQFKLHNVFTSDVDLRETIQPFKDYTLREQEISQADRQIRTRGGPIGPTETPIPNFLPKRLRSKAVDLVRKLQRLHSRCSYKELLEHYCHIEAIDGPQRQINTKFLNTATSTEAVTRPSSTKCSTSNTLTSYQVKDSLVESAIPASNVSAFCRAILSNIIPNNFWGDGIDGEANKNIIMHQIDRFVLLRRFESLSLHVVSQGLKITSIPWLCPPNINSDARTSKSDLQKRKQLLLEFIYYVFDSLLIPLMRSNFHVTESNVHRNRLFYFRHDVWRAMTEPALANIKISMFEEIKTIKARKLLDARILGFSQVRLMPKCNGFRLIMNLRRRLTKLRNGKMVLGRSINSVMAPVFNMLDYEKTKQPSRLGSALFSVGEIYHRLKSFRSLLEQTKTSSKPLYFGKVDVQSCFDTIPQRHIVKLMEQIASEDEYRIARHVEIKSSDPHVHNADAGAKPKPARKFVAKARAATDFSGFNEGLESGLANGKKNTVFVDTVVQTTHEREKMLDLLEEHVEKNVVKIGKKFFRQKFGIPQGSILSSLLCNYFYAELERETLGFLKDDESVLLRLIDDFLLITTNKEHAKAFLKIMHDGNQKYGVTVNAEKSLVNFDITINKTKIARSVGCTSFPYCGTMINMKTLEITKDRDRRKDAVLADSLTVEPSKVPGKTFHRKALNAFKIQTHRMFLDTTFNSVGTVLSTLYQNFIESAMKYYRYVKCMTIGPQQQNALLIGTIRDLIDLAFVLIKAKDKAHMSQSYACTVSKSQIQWLASQAFRNVLGRKQSKYGEVLMWLDGATEDSAPRDAKEVRRLMRIVKEGDSVFRDYKY